MSIDLGKAKKVLSQTFIEDNENVNEDDAAHLIVKSEQTIRNLTQEMRADERLAAAKQIVKDLQSSYKSAIDYEAAKIQYLLAKIDELQGNNADKPTD